ncbi:hypothetical protein [Saccharothrix deserti]|uniref:hypothetical protein n=1 Tax=Saccharothrix deserti TaxID=2593674 RepID=UPI00131AFA5D|nr:hypothetical protein [Saccharothrix deserti]
MEFTPALLSDDGVWAVVADVEACVRSTCCACGPLAEVLRRGLGMDTYQRLVRASPADVKQWTAQTALFLPSIRPTDHPCPSQPEHGPPARLGK